MMHDLNSAAAVYQRLENDRGSFLRRARQASKLTVTTILPEEGAKGDNLIDPFQSLGARAVNNLASKLLLTLLPPSTPFFKYSLAPDVEAALKDDGALTELQQSFSIREQLLMSALENMGLRPQMFEVLKHLLVTGNIVLKVDAEDNKPKARVFHLNQFVCERDGSGDLMVLCIKEKISPHKLSAEVRAQVNLEEDPQSGAEKTLDLYTLIERKDDGDFSVHQEVGGVVIPDSDSAYKAEEMPFLVLRWESISDESYGRSLVEQYIGDLTSLEGLTMAVVQGAAISAQMKILVRPNSSISIKKLSESPNGAILPGDPDDVGVVQSQKHADLSVAAGQISDIEQRLAQAFLLNSSITRDAERVTAEEIRYLAQQLEDALGGAYASLGQELQLPLVLRVEQELAKSPTWESLPGDVASITIITGLDALGRGHQVNKLQAFLGIIQQSLGPEALQVLKMDKLIQQIAVGLGVDTSEIVKSPEEMQAEQQAAQQAQMEQSLAPSLGKQLLEGGPEQQAGA